MPLNQPYRLGLITAATIFISGCATEFYYAHPRTVAGPAYVVDTPPPAPRAVVRPAAPYANSVWVDGYWGWNGGVYAWVPGFWTAPRAGYVYVQPRWIRRGRSWGFVGGYWSPRARYSRGVGVRAGYRVGYSGYGRRYRDYGRVPARHYRGRGVVRGRGRVIHGRGRARARGRGRVRVRAR